MPNERKWAGDLPLGPGEIDRFRDELLVWFRSTQRDLPWRRTRDPYAIWVSEIMLQQTRVAAVIPFYERFLERFPDFRLLAQASEPDLLAHWAGLGYYHRARNLQKAALVMCEVGVFPDRHDDIRMLPGVGDYTSAAVASIAFDLPFAAVDGNVMRVLSRVCNAGADVGTERGRKHFAALAGQFLSKEQPGAFNQAMMELGATICLPKNPQCLVCPVGDVCLARRSGRQNEFPVKLAKNKSVAEERQLLWIERDDQLLVWQRPAGSRLMPGFWELPELVHLPLARTGNEIGKFRHGITVHNYRFTVSETAVPVDTGICQWVALHDLTALPISTVLRKATLLVGKFRTVPALGTAAGA